MKIGSLDINKNSAAFLIAELSANHNGSKEVAIETIKAAKRAGADCVKFQTYTADTITLDHKSDDFKISQGTIWDGKYLYDLYKESFTPWEWHEELFKVCQNEGLIYFSSPFDKSAVDFLENLKVPAYKIASFEITDIPLIRYVASKGKPVIISTGIATLDDIELAVKTCRDQGNDEIALLQCTSSYPAPLDQANIIMVNDLAKRFQVISGLSDHTLGFVASLAAVAAGAKIIEKHFILDKSIGGPDSSFSMDEKEFSEMTKLIRDTEKSLGKVTYELTDKQLSSREHSRSLYVVENMRAGEKITEENIKSIRPGFGLHPKNYEELIGKKVNCDLSKGTALDWSMIE